MADDDDIAVSSAGAGRVQRLLNMFRAREVLEEEVLAERGGDRTFAETLRGARDLAPGARGVSLLRDLHALASRGLEQAGKEAETSDPNNAFARDQAREQARNVMRTMLDSLELSQAVRESPEFHALLALLAPVATAAMNAQQTGFERESGLHGKVKRDVLLRQVSDAVAQADKAATRDFVAKSQATAATSAAHQFGALTLAQMAREIRKRMQRRAKSKKRASELDDLDEVDEVSEVEEPEEPLMTREEADVMAERALAMMRAIREEIAPSWRPDQQPWMINTADREVYDIVLAVLPEELFQATEAFDSMQDLRRGHDVNTLRAADKLNEAMRRS